MKVRGGKVAERKGKKVDEEEMSKSKVGRKEKVKIKEKKVAERKGRKKVDEESMSTGTSSESDETFKSDGDSADDLDSDNVELTIEADMDDLSSVPSEDDEEWNRWMPITRAGATSCTPGTHIDGDTV